MHAIIFLTVLFASAGVRAKTYKRCELARELAQKLNISIQNTSTWVCIAYHESRFDTSAIGNLNWDSSQDHGLFQISELYWCGKNEPGGACAVPCTAFRDDDIEDDLNCARRIHEEHTRLSGDGFNAWAVYRVHCAEKHTKKYTAGCDNKTSELEDSFDFKVLFNDSNSAHIINSTTVKPPSTLFDIDKLLPVTTEKLTTLKQDSQLNSSDVHGTKIQDQSVKIYLPDLTTKRTQNSYTNIYKTSTVSYAKHITSTPLSNILDSTQKSLSILRDKFEVYPTRKYNDLPNSPPKMLYTDETVKPPTAFEMSALPDTSFTALNKNSYITSSTLKYTVTHLSHSSTLHNNKKNSISQEHSTESQTNFYSTTIPQTSFPTTNSPSKILFPAHKANLHKIMFSNENGNFKANINKTPYLKSQIDALNSSTPKTNNTSVASFYKTNSTISQKNDALEFSKTIKKQIFELNSKRNFTSFDNNNVFRYY